MKLHLMGLARLCKKQGEVKATNLLNLDEEKEQMQY
jgi:hypothetical protein